MTSAVSMAYLNRLEGMGSNPLEVAKPEITAIGPKIRIVEIPTFITIKPHQDEMTIMPLDWPTNLYYW